MKYFFFAIGLIVFAAVPHAGDKPKLGPEWTEDKQAQEYFKTMQIRVTRFAGGNTRGYRLDLEHDKVHVTDTDDNIATSVHINQTLRVEVRKDLKGAPSTIEVRIGKLLYFDLNCDGVWDAMYDNREADDRKRLISANGAWVRVVDSKLGFQIAEADIYDQKTVYYWDGKLWSTKKPSK